MGFLKALGFGKKVAPDAGAAAEPDSALAVAVPETTAVVASPKKKRKKRKRADAGTWTAAYSEEGHVYYLNDATGESAWELPEGAVLNEDAGAGGSGGGGHDACWNASNKLSGEARAQWIDELKRIFVVPPLVPMVDADRGKRIVFPDVFPVSPLVRLNVLEAQEPMRHKTTVSMGDLKDEPNDFWQPVHTIFVFACPMPNTQPYIIELRREPFGTRLKIDGKTPQSRDISKWRNYTPPRGFYTFPDGVANTANYSLDWSTGPDRYMISREPRPVLGWMRCLRFQGYAAHKFHVLETFEPSLAYRVVQGGHMVVERGWHCLFAFYAFEEIIPGTTRFFVQEQHEPHYRIRVGLEASSSHGWSDLTSFCAFDVPMPGTARFHVDFLIQSTESRTDTVEQSRVYIDDAWEPWQVKLQFYAYPAPTLLFEPDPHAH